MLGIAPACEDDHLAFSIALDELHQCSVDFSFFPALLDKPEAVLLDDFIPLGFGFHLEWISKRACREAGIAPSYIADPLAVENVIVVEINDLDFSFHFH